MNIHPDRTCVRCERVFRYPRDLRQHQARKTPCDPILDRENLPPETRSDPEINQRTCKFCGRVLGSYANMCRHVRQSCRIAPTERNGDSGMELLYKHTTCRQQARIEALEAQVANLTANVGAAAGGVAVVAGDNAQIAIDNSKKQVVINIHGREDISHIGAPQVRALLDESIKSGDAEDGAATALISAAMLIFSDPEHPENLTCFLPNKKTDDVLVHVERDGDTRWETKPSRTVLSPMAATSLDVIFDNQPSDENYAPIMRSLADNETHHAKGKELRAVLVSNKSKLKHHMTGAGKKLPRAGKGKEEEDE